MDFYFKLHPGLVVVEYRGDDGVSRCTILDDKVFNDIMASMIEQPDNRFLGGERRRLYNYFTGE